MSSPSVTIKEIDQSTRVPSFPGVYGGIVIKAKKGPVNEKRLVTGDKQFLSYFTPDEKVEVGYDLAYFSALSFLEKSDKLWVVRAAKQAHFSGVSIKRADAIPGSINQTCPPGSNIEDPTAWVFDSNPDVEAVKEVTKITCIADVAGSLDGKTFILSDKDGTVGFWIDVDDSGTPIPAEALACDRQVEITTIVTNDSASVVAGKVQSFINTDPQFVATVDGIDVTVTDAEYGDRDDGLASTSGFTVLVLVQGVDEIDNVDECMLIYSESPGHWGNDIGIKIITDSDEVKEADAFIIQVFKSSNTTTPIEEWMCSRKHKVDGYGRNIYVEDVLEGSNYIRAFDNTTVDDTVLPKAQLTVIFLGSGDDGLAVTDAEMIAAASIFTNPDDVFVTVLMDGGNTTPGYSAYLNYIAESRKDCVAVLSVPYADEASADYLNDVIDYRKTEQNLNTSFAALFSPHAKVYDRFNDRSLYVSPDGFAAAAISATAANYEMWYPPAGFRRGVVNALDLRRRYSKGEMDLLYKEGINPLRFSPGKGILIWGQKTLLSRPSSLDRLNVRLLLIQIEPAIKEALEDFLFELNDEATRALAQAKVEGYMAGIRARRGVTDFLVVCDSTNNTSDDIDNYRMNLDLYIKPTRSLEYIPFRVVLVSTGISFEQAISSV